MFKLTKIKSLYLVASVSFKSGKYDTALKQISKARVICSTSHKSHALQQWSDKLDLFFLRILFMQRKFSEIVEFIFNNHLSIGEHSPHFNLYIRIYFSIGAYYEGDYEAVVKTSDIMLGDNTLSTNLKGEFLLWKGKALVRQGKYREAISALNGTRQYAPGRLAAIKPYLEALNRLKRYDEVVELAEKAVPLVKKARNMTQVEKSKFFVQLGIAQFATKNMPVATKIFENVLNHCKKNGDNHLKEMIEAIRAKKPIPKAEKKSTSLLQKITAKIGQFLEEEDFHHAIDLVDSALEFYPENGSLIKIQIEILVTQGMLFAAHTKSVNTEILIEQCEELSPREKTDFFYLVGKNAFSLEKYEIGKEYLQKALNHLSKEDHLYTEIESLRNTPHSTDAA